MSVSHFTKNSPELEVLDELNPTDTGKNIMEYFPEQLSL